jgi:hypothetical protein
VGILEEENRPPRERKAKSSCWIQQQNAPTISTR